MSDEKKRPMTFGDFKGSGGGAGGGGGEGYDSPDKIDGLKFVKIEEIPRRKGQKDIGLAAAFKAYYRQRKRRESWHKVRKRTYHSSQGGKCQRSEWAKAKGVKGERELPYGIFDRGHKAEAHLKEVFEAKWKPNHVLNDVQIRITQEEEPLFPKGMALVGKADPTLIGMNLRPVVQTECKATAKWQLPNEPEVPHTYQVTTYAHAVMFEHCYDRELLHQMVNEDPTVPDDAWPFTIPPIVCSIIYIDPANYDKWVTFDFEYHPRLWRKIRDWYIEQHNANERNEKPPAKPWSPKECRYCDVRNWCGEPQDLKK